MRLKETNKTKLISIKVTEEDLREIKAKAIKYTKGNYSSWVRYAATKLTPNPKDLKRED